MAGSLFGFWEWHSAHGSFHIPKNGARDMHLNPGPEFPFQNKQKSWPAPARILFWGLVLEASTSILSTDHGIDNTLDGGKFTSVVSRRRRTEDLDRCWPWGPWGGSKKKPIQLHQKTDPKAVEILHICFFESMFFLKGKGMKRDCQVWNSFCSSEVL